jgi:dihydroorotate dehydrogenase subfamily 1
MRRIAEHRQIGDKRVLPFTIPSGIVMTEVSCLEKLAWEVPEIGILTTKSIGPKPRPGNREPILAQYMPYGFVNAVGLTNPGAEEFDKKLASANLPRDQFLLASIFGGNAEEFIYVAKTLENHVDGFELNLSCPHAKGYGMQLGQDPVIVGDITRAVCGTTKKPVFAKLTPNAGNIGEIAKAAVSAGAYGLVAINTVGPGYYSWEGNPVLTNKVGGLSGVGIKPIGLKCVRDIRQAVGEAIPIIGMGGIRTVVDVEDYADAGANFFGIGSALAGMNDREIKMYFAALREDLDSNGHTNNASIALKDVNTKYHNARVSDVVNPECDFKIFVTNESLDNAHPGQFVFAWLPGIGEKPFSVMDNNPLTLGILERGDFTRAFNSLKKHDSFYFRGPYGETPNIEPGKQVVLVGGGCGIAGVYFFAKSLKNNRITAVLGAKDKAHIPYVDEFEQHG